MPDWACDVLTVVLVLAPAPLLVAWLLYAERRDHSRLKEYMDDLDKNR